MNALVSINTIRTSNVYEFNKTDKYDFKVVTLTELILALRVAYVAACKAIGLANKIKNKTSKAKHKSRTMSLKNKIAKELNYYDNNGLSLFESVAYRGVLLAKF